MQNTYETKKQLAARLGLSCRTLNNWMAEGRIPYCKITERVIRFVPQEVDQALAKFTVRSRQGRVAS